MYRIDAPDGAPQLRPKGHLPNVPDDPDAAPQRIYVIGHPKGGDLTVTLYGNELDGIELPYFRYKSPTEGGSSGSPVFNKALSLIGLHHAARPELCCNEGIAFESILKAAGSDRS